MAESSTTDNHATQRRQLWIYFLGVGSKFIKIGKSREHRGKRLAQHRAASIDGRVPDIVPLCELKATSDADETAVHRYFAPLLAHGNEVFHAEPELIDYVRWLRDEHFVSVPEDADEFRNSLPTEAPENWMPRSDRRKKRDSTYLPGLGGPFGLDPRIVTIDDFYTSGTIIEAARAAMGSIDLDPATHPTANRVVRAARFYTAQTNGLAQPWSGHVWLNPPFSEWSTWSFKVVGEMKTGRVLQLCALAATRTLTANYFSPLLSRCAAICIFKGRIKFWGDRASTPDDGHSVLYFGARVEKFREAFKDLGTVFMGRSPS